MYGKYWLWYLHTYCGRKNSIYSIFDWMTWKINDPSTWENVPLDMCTQRRLKSAYASSQFDRSLRNSHEEILHSILSKWLIVLGFNDTSTLVVILCRLPEKGRKEIEEIVEEIREKRDRRDSRGDKREGQGRKKNRNESKEKEEIKAFHRSTLTCYKDSKLCPTVSQSQLDAPLT